MSGRDLQIPEAEPGIKCQLAGSQVHDDGTLPNVVVVGAEESHRDSSLLDCWRALEFWALLSPI